ncbi:MAG: hypothetical protein LLG00_16825, partial [Planctomycetaceae bacterium]|nr:hypothetical protein [Planctomycetaceae bacterium]
DRIVGTRKVETVLHGKHYHRFARHEQHVLNAICTTIGNSQVVMPPQVVSLIEQIPKWLYPHVRVIDGDIFRELIVEQDAGVEDWTKQIEVRDEPIWGVEPAVIVGHFVLTGWGPREVGQEQSRRQSIEQVQAKKVVEQTARWRASLFAVAAAVLTLVAILLLGQWIRGGGGLVFSFLASAAAIGAVWQAVFDFEHARGNATAPLAAHWLTGSIGCQILLAEWFIARWFQPMSWVTPVILGVGVIICHAVGRRLQ